MGSTLSWALSMCRLGLFVQIKIIFIILFFKLVSLYIVVIFEQCVCSLMHIFIVSHS